MKKKYVIIIKNFTEFNVEQLTINKITKTKTQFKRILTY